MNDLIPDIFQQGLATLPPALVRILLQLEQQVDSPLYLVGGTVRDWLLGRASKDLDIVSAASPDRLARDLRKALGGGAIVALQGQGEETVRLVHGALQCDFAQFRGGAISIEDDLCLRDFTLNALALPFSELATNPLGVRVIDPLGGLKDLREKVLIPCPRAFEDDPLRMLRGYRLGATLGMKLSAQARSAIRICAPAIDKSAVERIGYELHLIFESTGTTAALRLMAEDGLLDVLLPELVEGRGVSQPGFHHLDVYGHSMLTLEKMEAVLAAPGRYYPEHEAVIGPYLAQENVIFCLKWAALLHDVGKPPTRALRPDKGDRVTFYHHEREGVEIFNNFARRKRWSNDDRERAAGLIANHMYPFHLCNVMRVENLTKRAVLKLIRRAGTELVGLFLLAMADSLAGDGEMKPEGMEEELLQLFTVVLKIYEMDIKPVLSGPKLLTGNDLLERFALVPGPLIGRLLTRLEVARVEGTITDRQAAFAFVETLLRSPETTAIDGNCRQN